MIDDMYKVMDRINEIQRRFSSGKYTRNSQVNEGKNFKNTLNGQINSQAGSNTDIPASKIKEIAREYAVKSGLPPALVDAVIKVESGYNPKAVSKKGASGLMQLMPGVLKEMGVSDPFSVDDNISAGVNILKRLMDKYGWDFKKALSAYNGGEKAVDSGNGIPSARETREYVKKVIDAYIENIK